MSIIRRSSRLFLQNLRFGEGLLFGRCVYRVPGIVVQLDKELNVSLARNMEFNSADVEILGTLPSSLDSYFEYSHGYFRKNFVYCTIFCFFAIVLIILIYNKKEPCAYKMQNLHLLVTPPIGRSELLIVARTSPPAQSPRQSTRQTRW